MTSSFETDPHPDRPRILFIGPGDSTHTHSWIDLLDGAPLNVRLFSMSAGVPPDEWPTKTYITSYENLPRKPETRARLYLANRVARFAQRQGRRLLGLPNPPDMAGYWLAQIIRRWQPHVVHTLGIVQSGEFFFEMRQKHKLEGIGKWVLQTRGGSDLALSHLDPESVGHIGEVMRGCDQLVSDNRENFRIARSLGVREDQFADIAPVPGTGGIDVDVLASRWSGTPSERRLILLPKAYEGPWAKVLPVYEALKLCWERIQPCEIQMLSMNPETRMWYWALPRAIRDHCRVSNRVARQRVLELMTTARVMLAPSLVDGVPNSMYEAMSAGAFPIVSPLETIRPLVEDERNALFARNLYPEEIANALVRAMTDDALVDSAARINIGLVRRIANRSEIRPRVVKFYERLAGIQNLTSAASLSSRIIGNATVKA